MLYSATERSIIEGVADRARRPPERSVSQAVADCLKLPSGDYDIGLTPYMREPMDMLASRHVHTVCVLGPARCGKTEALIDGWITRNVVDDPGDMLVVHSSQDLVRSYSRVRFQRAIEMSPELRERKSPRRQDDNTYDKLFRSGMWLVFGWPSGAQLSGRDFRYVAVTEYDSASDDIDGEGSLYTLASMRTQTFLSAGKTLVESSVRREYLDANWQRTIPHEAPPATGITGIYNSGSMHWLYWRCEDCRKWVALDPDVHVMFRLPPLAKLVEELRAADADVWAMERAHLGCPHCGAEFDESRKRQLNGSARWVPSGCRIDGDEIIGTPRSTGVASYHIPCVAAAFASWHSILRKYAVAIQDYIRTGSESEIKGTVNLHQGRAYLPLHAGARRDSVEIAKREHYTQGIVPRGVRFLIATVDVQAGQRRGFVVQVIGFGAHREKWIVDRFALKTSRRQDGADFAPLDPGGYVEDWDVLIDKAITRRFPLEGDSSRAMAVRLTLCDSGGEDGVTSRAYEFHRRLREKGLDSRFRLVKGRDSGPTIEERFPDTRGRADRGASAGDVPVIFINTDALKDTLAADLARETPGPGYLHIPDWMDPAHVRELTAEVRTAKGWTKASGVHNESVDLAVYAEAGYHRLRGFAIDWRNPPTWAAEWDQNSEVTAGAAPTPPPTRRPLRVSRSNYLGRGNG